MNPDRPDDERYPGDRDDSRRRERNEDERGYDREDRPRHRRRRDEDDDDFDDRRPRRKKTSTLMIVLICLGVFLFCLLPIGLGLLLPAVQKVREAAARTISTNNMKMIGLAMHSHNDQIGTLPTAAIYNKQGKPMLSWRVALLPYLEEGALYKQFKLDEPWDSPNNIKLLSQMPKVYQSKGNPESIAEYKTCYRAFQGKGAIFDGQEKVAIRGLPKGPSNMILVVETKDAVPWTKPDDLPYEPNRPLPPVNGVWPSGFLALLADGSVRLLKKDVPEQELARGHRSRRERASEARLMKAGRASSRQADVLALPRRPDGSTLA